MLQLRNCPPEFKCFQKFCLFGIYKKSQAFPIFQIPMFFNSIFGVFIFDFLQYENFVITVLLSSCYCNFHSSGPPLPFHFFHRLLPFHWADHGGTDAAQDAATSPAGTGRKHVGGMAHGQMMQNRANLAI